MTKTTTTNARLEQLIEARVVEAVVRTSMMSVITDTMLTLGIQRPIMPTTATAATRILSSLAQNATAARAITHLTTAVT